MFTDEAPLSPVIDGLTCAARRVGVGGGGGGTNHRLRSIITDTIQNTIWENSAQRVKDKLMCFKKPLKSDSEKSERPIHNTKYQVQSKDKALKDPAAPPPRATTRVKVVDSGGEIKN